MVAEGVDGPGGAAAAEEVMVAGQDGGVESESESHRWPVSGVTWNAPSSGCLMVRVDGPRNHLDRAVIDEGLHRLLELMGLLCRETALFDDEREPSAQLVLGFVPLLLGDDHPKVGA